MKISITRTSKDQAHGHQVRAQPGKARRPNLAGATSSGEKHRVRVLGADADDRGPEAALEVGQATVDDTDDAAAGLRGWARRAKTKAKDAKQPQTHNSWTGGPAATTRVITGLVAAGIACGPVGLGLGLLNAQPPTPATKPIASTLTGLSASVEVGSFASEFLAAWVRADQRTAGALGAFGPVSGSSAPMKGGALSMVSVAGLSQTPVGVLPGGQGSGAPGVSVGAGASPSPRSSASGPGAGAASTGRTSGGAQVWTVRLAATVAAAGGVPAQRYYEVSVLREASGAMSVLAAPAVVAAPVRAASPSLLYSQSVRGDSQLASTTGAFLNALVAGRGDVTRYTTPGSSVRAVTPPAFAAVSVVQVASVEMLSDRAQDTPKDDAVAHVLVTAGASTGEPTATSSTVQYALTMTARQGRWEVTSIDPVGVASVGRAGEGVSASAYPASGSSTSPGATGH